MLSFTPLLLAAFPSVQYRLYGSNLTSTPRWTVHAIRLLASSTIATALAIPRLARL